jgi:hypothetical protein
MRRLGGVLFILALAGPRLAAASERALSVRELTAASSCVAVVEVMAVESDWLSTSAGKLPFIIYRVQTRSLLDGSCPTGFAVVVPGLIAKDQIITLPDEPAFIPGNVVVLFLGPAEAKVAGAATYRIIGSRAGALSAGPGPEGRGLVVAVPVPDRAERVLLPVSDLGEQVKAVRKNISDGSAP